MPITIQCPNPDCQQKYIIKEGSLGGQARCKKCGMDFTLEMKADETGELKFSPSHPPSSKRSTPPAAAQSSVSAGHAFSCGSGRLAEKGGPLLDSPAFGWRGDG